MGGDVIVDRLPKRDHGGLFDRDRPLVSDRVATGFDPLPGTVTRPPRRSQGSLRVVAKPEIPGPAATASVGRPTCFAKALIFSSIGTLGDAGKRCPGGEGGIRTLGTP
jgi:hypothetical protein